MRRLDVGLIAIAVMAVAIVFYWRTAFPGISWWENGELAAAASVLGVVHPPGSLIPTIAGWLFLKLPLGFSPAFQLNVLAGIVAVCVVALTMLVGMRLAQLAGDHAGAGRWQLSIILVLTALGFAFSRTLWFNGTIFTPYIFTALLTAVILWSLLRWWKAAGTTAKLRWMFIVFLLVGLDLSVHRTNALLIPGLGAAFLLREWRTVLSWRAWMAGLFGLAVGLSFYLLIMPMAAAHPPINANNPSTFGALWDYASMKQYGGGFLVNLYPRNGAFWSDQVGDYLTGFFANFANTSGPLGIIGVLPLMLGIVGLLSLIVRNRKLGLSFLILFLCTSLGAIVYFNVPANYFRAMDRHYLPSFVIFGMFMIVGTLAIVRWLQALALRWIALALVTVLLILMSAAQVIANYMTLDNSANYVASDTGRNIVNSVPDNAILIVAADTDTYPLWYLQMAENERPDVTVLNVNLLNTQWYVRQMQEEDSALGFNLSDSELAALGPSVWQDTTIPIPLSKSFVLPDGTVIDTAVVRFPPTLQEKYVLGHDIMVRRILCGNAWRRPVYISTFVLGQLGWLQPYSRSEGIVRQLMPYEGAQVDADAIAERLLTSYALRGFTDTTLTLDPMTKGVGRAYWGEFIGLLASTEDIVQRVKWRDQMEARIPLSRIDPPEQLVNALNSLCSPPAVSE